MSESPLFQTNFTAKQFECFRALEGSPLLVEALGGGGKGGGKSNLLCKWLYYKAKSLIQFFDLRVSENPPILGFLGRKRSTDLGVTTLETWKKDIPPSEYRINEQKKLITINNAASILYGGFDDRETVNKFNSMELAFAGIDQAEELTREEIGSIRGTLRLKLKGKQPDYKMLLTCNPPITDEPDFVWIKSEFIDNPISTKKFFKFLWKDNPHIASNYEQTLTDAYGFNPDLLAAYKDGEWDRIGASNLIIPRRLVEWNIENNSANIFLNYDFVKRVTACDVASSGDDETVIYDSENTKIVGQEIYCHKDEMDTVGRIVAHAAKNRSSVIVVDMIGIGAGVYSRLKEIYREQNNKIYVYGYDSRVKPPEGIMELTYLNWRAYAWSTASKSFFAERKCNIPNDVKLISQLCSQKFRFHSGGKIMLIPKNEDNVESRDRADCYVMLLDALRHCKSGEKRTENKKYGWKNGVYTPPSPEQIMNERYEELIPS